MVDAKKVNVLLLGAAFHLLFFSFQTSVFIQQTVVNSLRQKPGREFTGDGYVSLCITYAVFALANLVAPRVIARTGVRLGMFLGATTYVLYSASFIYPTTGLFYLAAALVGLGAGHLWTAQCSCLAQNSDAQTSTRNAAIFWSMLQSSILLGNLFVFFAFHSQETISDQTRGVVYGVLTLVGALGALVLLLLRDPDRAAAGGELGGELGGVAAPANDASASEGRGAHKRHMVLLSVAFLFTGQLLCFFTGVYGTAIGATSQFGPESKKYIGLAGILIGVGEIAGGSVFGLLGRRVHKLLGRDTIFVFGFLVAMGAFVLTFVNLPPDSSLVARSQLPAIIQPKVWISMLSSFLIGLADACFNTQLYSIIMSVYTSNSVGTFALFKFVQSAGSAAAFLYSTKLDLQCQLVLLGVAATAASVCFCAVERGSRSAVGGTEAGRWRRRRRRIDKTDSQQSIVAGASDEPARPVSSPRSCSSVPAAGLGRHRIANLLSSDGALRSQVIATNK